MKRFVTVFGLVCGLLLQHALPYTQEQKQLPAIEKPVPITLPWFGKADLTGNVESRHLAPDSTEGLPDATTTVAGSSQLPGDCNQDGAVNSADVLCLVNMLFSGFNLLDRSVRDFPCTTDGGNLAVLDISDNQAIDVADIVGLADFLFSGGSPPPGGASCRLLDEALGCPEMSGCQ